MSTASVILAGVLARVRAESGSFQTRFLRCKHDSVSDPSGLPYLTHDTTSSVYCYDEGNLSLAFRFNPNTSLVSIVYIDADNQRTK